MTEDCGLAGPEQRARAVALGIPVTMLQPLLHDTAQVEEGFWRPGRAARLFPVCGWIGPGAQVGTGSDFPVGQFGTVRSVWGMTTRQIVIGVKGPERVHDTFLARGIPTVFGEYGVLGYDFGPSGGVERGEMLYCFEAFGAAARTRGVATFLWDNDSCGLRQGGPRRTT
ncbi:hypothetical protein [Streptomyces monashensis]|uniref:Uncharacterized protein n=1 Tax=Streptomyces monashensis TaxID=1678012 RepID=A0A1S2PE09_9ACTN|nr:hypothetical protein [Streptomyces monashensis]OIJ91836.1 hypothetical protein BIV23_39220 [Streptomyces monashensis]